MIGGVERKLHYFAMALPHSDAFFIKAYPGETSAELPLTTGSKDSEVERPVSGTLRDFFAPARIAAHRQSHRMLRRAVSAALGSKLSPASTRRFGRSE